VVKYNESEAWRGDSVFLCLVLLILSVSFSRFWTVALSHSLSVFFFHSF